MPGQPERGPVAVVTAIREELRAILACARDVRFDRQGYARGRIGAIDVVIAATGDGPRNAERGAGALWDAYNPAVLVGAGLAGGLTPDLAALEVVVSAEIRNGSGLAPRPDPTLLARAVAAGARPAALITVARPVLSAAAKRDLAASRGTREPAAVDMESAAWARFADHKGAPYIVLRAISDAANEEMPDFLQDCLDADGGIGRSAVALRALPRPSSWAALNRMRRRARDGSRALALLLGRLFAEPL